MSHLPLSTEEICLHSLYTLDIHNGHIYICTIMPLPVFQPILIHILCVCMLIEIATACLDLYNSVSGAVCSELLQQRGQNSCQSESCIYNQSAVMWWLDWGSDPCHLPLIKHAMALRVGCVGRQEIFGGSVCDDVCVWWLINRGDVVKEQGEQCSRVTWKWAEQHTIWNVAVSDSLK